MIVKRCKEITEREIAEMAKNARKTAEVYDFKKLTKKLIEIMETR